ncbi:hypothetical protein MPH_10987 [Macrophomina phaseolina MS6]|uniref:Uncharacterized protein n=1 Tax=Macrophomina phaseolina (strain MS6) TaxID=1126212 RepID=K2RBL1_MACPH|nr:hypothetical protein MPH_10987 [Macrophomina phaseolina MS6]
MSSSPTPGSRPHTPSSRAALRHPSHRARLLDLPAELRQLILIEALRDPQGVHVTDEHIRGCQLKTLLALLLVSRAIHAEALAVFASANQFTLDNAGGLLFLLKYVGFQGRPQLRTADIVFSRPTGRGFVDGEELKEALLLLPECVRFKVTVELSLRAVQAPWNHAHERENEHCRHYPHSAKNKAGKNFWIHPASVCDTPYAEELRELVRKAAAVRWSGSPLYSWSSSSDDSMDFIRKSEEWLRPRDAPGFKYICSWELPAPAPPATAIEKNEPVVRRFTEASQHMR